jgi:hypothetical protein
VKNDTWHYTPGGDKVIISTIGILLNLIQILSNSPKLVDTKRSLNIMVQIFVVAYLVISFPVVLLLWAVLAATKRVDDKNPASESSSSDRFLESQPKSINLYSS